jgi:hypothetical protein
MSRTSRATENRTTPLDQRLVSKVGLSLGETRVGESADDVSEEVVVSEEDVAEWAAVFVFVRLGEAPFERDALATVPESSDGSWVGVAECLASARRFGRRNSTGAAEVAGLLFDVAVFCWIAIGRIRPSRAIGFVWGGSLKGRTVAVNAGLDSPVGRLGGSCRQFRLSLIGNLGG